MKKMEKIQIGEKTYPIKMDLNVLESIQDQYGSVRAFELDLIGIKLEEDGNGKKVATKVEPSIKAIKTALPLMINEGLEIEAAVTGKSYDPVEELQIIQECCIPFDELARIIHAELKRCFGKKQQPGERTKKRTCR